MNMPRSSPTRAALPLRLSKADARIPALLFILLPLLAMGCATHQPKAIDPTSPVQAAEGLNYLTAALSDSNNRVVAYAEWVGSGELDEMGRQSLRAGLAKWWHDAEVVDADPKKPTSQPAERIIRGGLDAGTFVAPVAPAGAPQLMPAFAQKEPALWSTPDMEITIHGKAPGDARSIDPRIARIEVFKSRQMTRILISDPNQPRFKTCRFLIHSIAPEAWMMRLFAGKL